MDGLTLHDLIEQLEDLAEEHGEDTMVYLAVQPSWPLAHEVAAVTLLEGEDDAPAVWIAATQGHPYGRSPYAPRAAWGEDGGEW